MSARDALSWTRAHRHRESVAATSVPILRLEPTRGWRGFALKEAWRSRELLVFLAERDLRVRYKQTFFGAAWAIAQPVISMLLFTLVFGRVAKLPSAGLPYALLALSGTVPWMLVASGVSSATTSLVGNPSLISKVYVHKMLLPAATVLATLADLAIAIVLLIVVAGFYDVWPTWHLLVLPFFILLGTCIVLGVGMLLAAVNIVYRDVRYVVPYLVQAWLFATPVAYAVTALDDDVQWWFALNPFTGIVEGFRWSVLGTGSHLPLFVSTSVVGAILMLVGGAYVFRRLEPIFADVA